MSGNCLAPPSIRVWATTTIRSIDDTETERSASYLLFGQSILFPLILLAVLLIFCMLLTLLYCVQRRGTSKKFRETKLKGAEFVSKGFPVVFPEEVPHGEDDDDSGLGHGVTTPMLIAHEQPAATSASATTSPIQFADQSGRMTLHENPLYKPPPVTQAQLLSHNTPSNYQSAAPTTSTFAPHNNNNSASPPMMAPTSARTPTSTAAVGQRLPPPYMAAI